MSKRNSLGHHLIEISQKIRTDESTPMAMSAKQKLFISRRILPQFQAHKLVSEHILIIARLFEKTIKDSGQIEPLSLLKEIYQDPHVVLDKLKLILQLIESRIVDCDRKKYLKVEQKSNRPILRLDPSFLIGASIGFNDGFLSFALGSGGNRFSTKPKPFKNNQEYLGQWFAYVGELHDAGFQKRFSDDAGSLYSTAIAIKEAIDSRLEQTKKRFPFSKIAQDYNLTHDEQVVLIYVLKESQASRAPSNDDLQYLINNTIFTNFSNPNILSDRGVLIKKGILIRSEEDGPFGSQPAYKISPTIASQILNGRQQSDIAIVRDIIKHGDLFSVQRPAISFRNLVLPQGKLDVISEAISQYKTGGRDWLKQWGFRTYSKNDGCQTRGQLSGNLRILCYGPPGTGKTALAHAIASTLKRLILFTDISRLESKWVGDSEKNVSKLFSTYRRICQCTKLSPVLLLDEADQFISSRSNIAGSIDRSHNQVQNIFLENLEKFDGILIATTNLLDNIDDAFSRRFDIKIELKVPQLQMRRKLWKKIIPSALPLSDDVNLDELASGYLFTGGQIRIVVHNTAVAVAARSRAQRIVRQEDFVRYAELEQHGSFDRSTRNPIGFS